MTNKLVAIINSLKVPKIKKILLYEMKFLVPNYSCLQNPRLGGYRPQIPVLSVHCPQLNLLNPPPNKIPGYATAFGGRPTLTIKEIKFIVYIFLKHSMGNIITATVHLFGVKDKCGHDKTFYFLALFLLGLDVPCDYFF